VIADTAWWALGGAIAGLIAGSFIATLVIRWPQGRELDGRSACDACGRVLSLRDLVPVLSWAAAGGKCRTCSGRIDWRHPAIEVVAALIGVAAMWLQPNLHGVAGALFGWQLLALAALDVEHFWLPDWLTGLLAVSGLALGALGLGTDLPSRLIGGGFGFAALFAISWTYRRLRGRAGMGGGDPKLLGAIGCWLGWSSLPYVLVGASIIGLTVALLMLVRGKDVAATTRLPFGALMAVAAFPFWLLLTQI
jgi:leader peptidase (prepilin peptidase) / N-methyltransferase